MYYGPQEYDAPTAATIVYHLADGTGISVKFIDGQAVAPSGTTGLEPHKAPGRITGFKAKVHALVWVTSFDQVSLCEKVRLAVGLSETVPLTGVCMQDKLRRREEEPLPGCHSWQEPAFHVV